MRWINGVNESVARHGPDALQSNNDLIWRSSQGGAWAKPTNWPKKTCEMHSHHFDSTIWNDFRFRDDDIVISTYAKSGTTWMQQMIGQMLMGPDPDLEVARDVAVARSARATESGEAADGRGADAPALPQDTPAGRCARLLARRRSTSTSAATAATSCGASTTTTSTPTRPGIRRSTTRPVGSVRPIERPPGDVRAVLARLAVARRLPVLAVLGQHPELVCDSRFAQRPAGALREPQARHAGTDAPHRGVPRHTHRRVEVEHDPSSTAPSTG